MGGDLGKLCGAETWGSSAAETDGTGIKNAGTAPAITARRGASTLCRHRIFLALWGTEGFFMDITPEKEESARKGPHSMFMPLSFPVEGDYSAGESSALASFFAFSSFCFLF